MTAIKATRMARIFSGIAAGLLLSLQAIAALPVQHWQSPSGARVYFVENHDLPILDMSVTFAAGSSRDLPEKPGVAALTSRLLTLGAAGLSDDEISTRFADLGAQLAGDYDADRAGLKLRTLSSEVERTAALKLFASLLQQPDFPVEVLEREKARTIANLREAATQPESISSKAFGKALYGSHPYALDELIEPETVEKVIRDDLVSFHRTYFIRNQAVVAIIGDVTRIQAEQIAEQMTSGLPKGAAIAPLPAVSKPARAAEQRIDHPAAQSHIVTGYPGIKRGDPDYFPLYVGNYILGGGGFVSRLMEEVRDKRGYAYSVFSYFQPLQEAGPFQIGLQTKREQTDQALSVVRETLREFIDKGPTGKELKAAKDNLIGGFPLRIDSNGKILDYLAMIGFYQLPLTYLDDFNKEIAKVTTAQIRDAFKRRVDPDKMVTVVVGGSGAK